MEAILEAIQNGLDARAAKINVNINQRNRSVHIQDDGDGASKVHMDNCLQNIAKSQKDRGKLGQFGIGVVASFGKCKRFTFMSRGRDSKTMHRWVFDCGILRKATTRTSIPCAQVNGHVQWWNSELCIEDYTSNQLRAAIDFDAFCTAIYDRYGAAMLRHRTTISVRLTTPDGERHESVLPPMDFTGTPLPVQTYNSSSCGKTTVRMFVVKKDAKNTRRKKGQGVRVMDATGFTLPLTEKVFPGGLFKKKDADLFQTGHFEGEIVFSDRVQLDASRRFFVEDEATLAAVIHIERWLDDHGRKLLQQMDDEATSARYRRLGDQSLKVIDRFLKDERNSKFANMIRSFKWGSQGTQHSSNNSKKSGESTGTRANGGGSGKKRGPSDSPRVRDPDHKPRERKKDTPLIVDNPDGNPRVHSKHDSTGLILSYEQGGSDLWKLDKDYGIIRINIAHPTWVAHDRLDGSTQGVRNQLICQLQERIILHVLLSLKLADDLGADLADILCLYAHEFEDHNHFLTTQADKIAQRGRFRPRSNSKTTTEEDN
ncbi:MAG: ATP-binding protein [Nitrospira sp.]